MPWPEYEVGAARLGDERLRRRALEILDQFMEKPQASIPQATKDWAGAKAAYRFMDNDKVDPEAIMEPHRHRTTERAGGHPVVLAIGDTTMLDYTSHSFTEGLGPLSDLSHRGFLLHPTLVVTPERVPLGLIDHTVLTRDEETFAPEDEGERSRRPIEEKESVKWVCSLVAAERLKQDLTKAGSTTEVVCVFDREGDIYEVLGGVADPRTTCEILVRAKTDRSVESPWKHLWATMEALPVAGRVGISLPQTSKRKAREADLVIRFQTLTLRPPGHRSASGELGPVTVQVVYAHEETPPKAIEPVSWMLITTVAVNSFEDACRILSWYCCRWVIELLFRVLKSGCKTEERQLETADRLKRCLVFDLIVAWRVLYLTTIGRDTPDLPCTVIFEDHEWKSLYLFVYRKKAKVPKTPPTLRQVTRLIGRLGGHLGRKGDGEPGQVTMWRGISRLSDISAVWLILHDQMRAAPEDST